MSTTAALPDWPETLTRVPYWVFQREDVYAAEQEKLFRGPCWNYLCLEAEVASPGQYRTSYLGDLPVIVARDQDGEIYAFENRCAHRGALLALDNWGTARDFTCVYHAWSYKLQGDLTGVAFEGGIKGKGGMPESFCKSDHAPRKLRLTVVHGLVFGSLSDDVDDIEDYLGDEIMDRIERVLGGRTPVVIGRYTQMLPNNWKLYVENVKDSYHASILHLFFTTFEINRLSQRGGIIVSENGGHHVSYSAIDRTPSVTPPMPSRTSAPRAASGWPIPRCWTASARSVTTPLSRSCRRSPRSCCSRSRTRWQCARSCRARSTGPSSTGPCSVSPRTPPSNTARLKQSNLVGSAGYVSMEDGCVGGFVQRGVAGASDQAAVVEMGGASATSSESRVTEASIRGIWKAYLAAMGISVGIGTGISTWIREGVPA